MKPLHFSFPSALLALGVACCVAVPAQAVDAAKPDVPADYAYALPLQISGKQGVVGLRLPQSVYLKARTAGLDDLRVFDAKGMAQPFSLYRPPLDTAARRATLAFRRLQAACRPLR
jgi:hypothetical protein